MMIDANEFYILDTILSEAIEVWEKHELCCATYLTKYPILQTQQWNTSLNDCDIYSRLQGYEKPTTCVNILW